MWKVWKAYSYDLRSLVLALQDAQLHSLHNGPHDLTVVEWRGSRAPSSAGLSAAARCSKRLSASDTSRP